MIKRKNNSVRGDVEELIIFMLLCFVVICIVCLVPNCSGPSKSDEANKGTPAPAAQVVAATPAPLPETPAPVAPTPAPVPAPVKDTRIYTVTFYPPNAEPISWDIQEYNRDGISLEFTDLATKKYVRVVGNFIVTQKY